LNKYIKCNLEASSAVQPLYGSLGVKGLILAIEQLNAQILVL